MNCAETFMKANKMMGEVFTESHPENKLISMQAET